MSLLDHLVVLCIYALGLTASGWVGWATGIGWVPAVCMFIFTVGVLKWWDSRKEP